MVTNGDVMSVNEGAPAFTAVDHAMMAQALRLAERGAYTTKPNPMVGCVIAQGETVVGEGWHQRAGGPHAEVFALEAAGERARGATAYVTLEPCAHTGRTGPCADALIAAGIARVVAAMRDPFPQVDGAGFEKLDAAGIVVEHGLMAGQARRLNQGFLSRIERRRPWVRVKLATSLDGRTALANGDSKWISSEASRRDVMQWRARAGALLTGAGTVLADDPRLTVRFDGDDAPDFEPPLRVVLDPGLAIPAQSKVLDDAAPTLLLHAPEARVPKYLRDRDRAAIPASDGMLDLEATLRLLAQRGINEVQTEAGATLCGGLLRAGLVDELLLYVVPVLLGANGRPLFAGLALFMLASTGCALAPDIHALIALRFLQGLGACAGMIIARSCIRDLHSGEKAARLMATMLLVMGASPIFAPLVGSVLLHQLSWRGLFVVIALLVAVSAGLVATALKETLPPERRAAARAASWHADFTRLLADSRYLALACATSGATCCTLLYVTAAPFVFARHYELSPGTFSALLGLQGTAHILSTQLTPALMRRWGAARSNQLEQTLRTYLIIPVDVELCRTWGRVRAEQRRLDAVHLRERFANWLQQTRVRGGVAAARATNGALVDGDDPGQFRDGSVNQRTLA